MTTGLEIGVRRLQATLVTLGGTSQQATFFLPVPDNMEPATTILGERLNDPDNHFMPYQAAGAISLVRVSWIAYVALDGQVAGCADPEAVGALRARVDLDLTTGEHLVGDLLVEGSEWARRVSDYLNTGTRRFVPLCTTGSSLLVNRKAIARVRLQPR